MNEKKVSSVLPAVDELQRDLKVELVDFLRQQNAQLMMQVSDLKTALEARGDQASAGSSPWSTVVDGESLGKRSAMGAKRWSSRSPRPTRKQGHASPVKLAGDGRVKKDDKLQCTPNGTRIPDGPPPMDDVSRMPSCPPPPVPPFPIPHTADAASDLTEKMDLKAYEVCQDGPLRGRMGDPGWKPTSEKSLTPQEAKSAWLEREVNSLKKVLEKVATDGNSFDISKTWPLKEGCHQCLSKPRHWSSGVCCMVNMFMEIGLLCKVLQHCMAWRLVNLNFKLGLCMVLGRVVCLVKLLFMVGHCMALFLVMELFMVGHCMARFLVMEHFLIGLCMVVLRSLGFKILFNKGILFKERKGKELWVLHRCQHHGIFWWRWWRKVGVANVAKWCLAAGVWRLALSLWANHERPISCRWKMVGCYGASSSCLLHGMEGTISSSASSTLPSSSWRTDGKLLHQNGAAGCHAFAQSSERWATKGAGGGSRPQQHSDTFSPVCATSTRWTWRKGNPPGPIDFVAKGVFNAGSGFFVENMAATLCKSSRSRC